MLINLHKQGEIERTIEQDYIIVPGESGRVELRDDHTPIMLNMVEGELKFSGSKQEVVIGGGFLILSFDDNLKKTVIELFYTVKKI